VIIELNHINTIIIFILGMIFGSFLNVVIYRIPEGISIIKPGSFCPECSENLKWYELIPLISYLILLGRCSHCKSKISIQYPLIELGNGLLFIILFYYSIDIPQFIFLAILGMALLCLVVIDFKDFILPDVLIILSFIIAIIYFGYYEKLEILPRFYFAILTGGGLYILRMITSKIYKKETFGLGDIKLAALIGFIIGKLETFLALFFGFFIAAVIFILLIITGVKKRDAYLPFGPYLIFGMVVCLIWGDKTIQWYSSFFH